MSIFYENVTKTLSAYDKIRACIKSSTTLDHLVATLNLIENWVRLFTQWEQEILKDRSDKHRKSNYKEYENLLNDMSYTVIIEIQQKKREIENK